MLRFDIAAFLTLTVTHFTELPSNSWLCLSVYDVVNMRESGSEKGVLMGCVFSHLGFFFYCVRALNCLFSAQLCLASHDR